MIGDARRSKGCSTCRRRRIRCDLQQPTCRQCHKSKRHCGGYERPPIFISYTAAIVEQPKPDETKALSGDSAFRSNRKGDTRISTSSDAKTSLPPNAFHSWTAEASRYLSWAYENYIETSGAKNQYSHMPITKLLYSIMTVAESDPALDHAMLAISCKMCAVFYKDPALINKGRQLYTRSLSFLQRSLRSQKLALKDETLAATCVLAMYELTSVDGTDPDAWLSHIAGMMTLLKARGAEKQRRAFPRIAFEHCRYNLTMKCILSRDDCGFASKEWLDDPWSGSSKGLEQKVMDEGLKLAQILRRLEEGARSWPDIKRMKDLTEACFHGYSRIQRLKTQVLLGLQSSLETDSQSSTAIEVASNDPESQISNRLVLRLTASGIQLGLCQAAHSILRTAAEFDQFRTEYCGDGVWKLCSRNSFAEISMTAPEDGTKLANEIVNEASEVFHKAVTTPEVVRLMFPLKMALRTLAESPLSAQYERCKTFVRQLQGGHYITKPPPRERFVYGNSREKNATAIDRLI